MRVASAPVRCVRSLGRCRRKRRRRPSSYTDRSCVLPSARRGRWRDRQTERDKRKQQKSHLVPAVTFLMRPSTTSAAIAGVGVLSHPPQLCTRIRLPIRARRRHLIARIRLRNAVSRRTAEIRLLRIVCCVLTSNDVLSTGSFRRPDERDDVALVTSDRYAGRADAGCMSFLRASPTRIRT